MYCLVNLLIKFSMLYNA